MFRLTDLFVACLPPMPPVSAAAAAAPASPIAVIDFETTGMSPAQGARATEIAIVLLGADGQVLDRFQSLVRTGAWVSPFITQLTGITNAMVASAPDAAEVMQAAARFVGSAPMAAHNAAFDRRFWQHELACAGLPAPQPFACTVLLSRRLHPHAPSHQLGRLIDFHGLPRAGVAHRALADAEMAASLLALQQRELRERWGVPQPGHAVLQALQRCARPAMGRLLARWAQPPAATTANAANAANAATAAPVDPAAFAMPAAAAPSHALSAPAALAWPLPGAGQRLRRSTRSRT